MVKDGPFKSAFESSTEGVIRQEFITYRMKDGMMQKEITTRRFSGGGSDYFDSSTSIPLAPMESQ